MTASHFQPYDRSGWSMHPSISPRALSERVAEAIQHQDVRLRGGGNVEGVRELRVALADLQDVLGRALTIATDVMARPDYERLAVEIGGVTFATMRDNPDGDELLELRRRVATVTVRLAVLVTLSR